MGEGADWGRVVEGLVAGDRLAVLALNRLVTGVLVHLRGYDIREEWDDLRQDVLLAVLANARAGRLREPAAFVAYVRAITRNKVVDRIKQRVRRHEADTIAWDEAAERAAAGDGHVRPDETAAVWAVVETLPGPQRAAIVAVYREGRGYEEAAAAAGLPLGTLKRRLAEGLRALRERLAGADDPIGAARPTPRAGDPRGKGP